ncbi:MAG: ComF family protein [Bryobacteraceae bacterium]
MRTAGWLLDVLFPDDCRICGSPLTELSRYPVCAPCLLAAQPFQAEHACSQCHTPFLNRAPLDEQGRCALCRLGGRAYDDAWSYGAYEGPVRTLVHLLKYEGIRTLASPLGALLSRALPRQRQFDVIVPVPIHWRRRWMRGFNQAELLAADLSRRTGIPVAEALERRHRPAQAGLSSAARRRNAAGAFSIAAGAALAGRKILLIDDVLTTGSTAAACASVLKRAGAARVSVLTLARADRRYGREALLANHPAVREMSA